MREIKFRAWDIDGKIMCFGQVALDAIPLAEINPEVKIMQYTGLLDRTGKEIYEGDIVKFGNWKPKEIVYYYKNFAGFSLKDTDCWLLDYDTKEMEVIGNIYENPELIKA